MDLSNVVLITIGSGILVINHNGDVIGLYATEDEAVEMIRESEKEGDCNDI